jgi:lysophospholipase L1-like esterase
MAAKLPGNLVLALASTLAALALVELGSYAFGVFDGPLQQLKLGQLKVYGTYDPLLFWSLRPGAAAPGLDLQINEYGLRGPELTPKQPGELRVLSLGESTTFAAELSYAEAYSALLEQGLIQTVPERRIRVLNAGVPGYSLFQGVQYLLHRSPDLEPDVVLLYFGYNDFLPVAYLGQRTGSSDLGEGLNDWELYDLRRTLLGRMGSWLMQYSNLYRGVIQRRARRHAAGVRRESSRPRVPPIHRERLLDLALGYTQQVGIQLVVVIPVYRNFDAHVELLRGWVERNGVVAVDLPERLEHALRGSRTELFPDRIHPSPAGHRLIAAEIVETLSPLIR